MPLSATIAKSAEVGLALYEGYRAAKRMRTSTDAAGGSDGGSSTINSQTIGLITKLKGDTRKAKLKRARQIKNAVKSEIRMAPTNKVIHRSVGKFLNASAAGTQLIASLNPLYSYAGSTSDNDLEKIVGAFLPGISMGSNYPANNTRFSRFHFTFAKQTIELTSLETSKMLYVDVYEYYCTKRVNAAAMSSLIQSPTSMTGALTPIAITSTTVGVEPFDIPSLTNAVHFTKVYRLQLAPLSSQELFLFDYKPKLFENEKYADYTSGSTVGIPGWTKGFFMRACSATDGVTTTVATTLGLGVLITNEYHFRVLPSELVNIVPTTSGTA